jgi:hypothetical protein
MLDVESGSSGEELVRKFGYTEVGTVPKHGKSPSGEARDQTFFYKSLES